MVCRSRKKKWNDKNDIFKSLLDKKVIRQYITGPWLACRRINDDESVGLRA